MSMVRTALRILVVEALKNATIAGARVFDSRMADLTPDLFKGDNNPVILAMTDKDEGSQLSLQNGGPPFIREAELSLEFGIVQRVQADGEVGLVYPNTDARHEAALDFMEMQVMRHLQYADNPLCILFRRFWRITKYDCHRQIFEETSMKVACRVLTLICHSGDDQVMTFNLGATPPTGYDTLPDPLQSVCKLMPDGTSGKDVCDLITEVLTPLTEPQLTGVDFTYDAGNTTQGDVPSTEIKGKVDVETFTP